jgi:putative ABC transport system permease protein
MYKFINYIKTSINLWKKQWIGVAIAVSGLSIAFALSLIAVLYVKDGLTSDSWLDNSQRLYRIENMIYANGQKGVFSRGANATDGHKDYILQNFTEVEDVTRLEEQRNYFLEKDGKQEDEVFHWADANLFNVLNLPVLIGDGVQALEDPSGLLISERKALELFGRADATVIGERLTFGQNSRDEEFKEIQIFRDYVVKAIIRDIPSNSVLDIDLLALRPEKDTGQRNTFPHVPTYLLLKEGVDFSSVKADFEKRLTENTAPVGNYSFEMFVEPLEGALLFSEAYSSNSKVKRDEQTMWTIASISLVLILTAGFNYINVFTAINSLRSREIAVRRISGAAYKHIVAMCLLEGIIISVLAYGVAVLLANDLTDVFKDISGAIVPVLDGNRIFELTAGFVIASIIGVFGAFYPAFIMGRARPETLLRSDQGSVIGARGYMRKALVGVQAFVTVGIMIASSQVSWQMDHLVNLDRGFKTNGVFAIEAPKDEESDIFKNGFVEEVRQLGLIEDAELVGSLPFSNRIRVANYRNPEEESPKQVILRFPGPGFLSTLTQEPLAKLDVEIKDNHIALPERALKTFGFETANDALGKTLAEVDGRFNDTDNPAPEYIIAAVVPDLKDGGYGVGIYSVYHFSIGFDKFLLASTNALPEEINALVQPVWNKYFPEETYEVEWIIDRLRARHKNTQDMGLVLNFIGVITVILGFAGLYGMARHWLYTKRRELALRRVMGAEAKEILRFAVFRMLAPVFIGGVIALVPVWLIMQEWMTQYGDKANLPLPVYGVVLMLALLMSSLILLVHIRKALREHPAKVLYHE